MQINVYCGRCLGVSEEMLDRFDVDPFLQEHGTGRVTQIMIANNPAIVFLQDLIEMLGPIIRLQRAALRPCANMATVIESVSTKEHGFLLLPTERLQILFRSRDQRQRSMTGLILGFFQLMNRGHSCDSVADGHCFVFEVDVLPPETDCLTSP